MNNARRSKNGFTLIEIVVVIAIVATMLAATAAMFYRSKDEHRLRESSEEVELLAKRARFQAIVQQIPYAIKFTPEQIEILVSNKVNSNAETSKPQQTSALKQRRYLVPAEMKVSVRRWNSEEWLPIVAKKDFIWGFDPEGLSEPISVRFEYRDSFGIYTFHPLTASIAGVESEIH